MAQLQFVPFGSNLEPAFWHNLTQLKLNEWKLETASRPIHGFYSYSSSVEGAAPPLRLDFSAFDASFSLPASSFLSHGTLKNSNTLDEFKSLDKVRFLAENCDELWRQILRGEIFEETSGLNRFVVSTFADLKKYDYYYWFGFAAFSEPKGVLQRDPASTLDAVLTPKQVESLVDAVDAFTDAFADNAFFVVSVDATDSDSQLTVHPLKADSFSTPPPSTESAEKSRKFLCFCDPSNFASHPGWPLRNLLTLYAVHFAEANPEVDVICLREKRKDGVRSLDGSLVLRLNVPPIVDKSEMPAVVGWEKNERGKLGPRRVNLSESMDPRRVAESAVDLNLKLMRWRLVPELDLETLANTKVLILGSGTLGCNVARGLMGWGFRHLTFLDCGKVSFSNPVRQSLFTFADCLDGGKSKSAAAKDATKLIFPGVEAESVDLAIPMPGHSVSEKMAEQVMEDVRKLDRLVSDHDAIFLLMDTRESRWLPTVMANAKGKLVINAALGFDSFVVMRHGVKRGQVSRDPPFAFAKKIPGNRLGCYFCNDVVAPGDSTKDRTLDQQCTVTRPGVSMIASALAVELLVGVLQHPQRGCAFAQTFRNDDDDDDEGSCLGVIPHQIRGFLSRLHQVTPSAMAFDRCTACSDVVVRSYLGFDESQWERHKVKIDENDPNYNPTFSEDFLLKAFNEPNYLEDITGLTELHEECHNAEIWELDDDDDDEDAFECVETA